MIHVLNLTGHDRHWAEDVVQETMIKAWRNADKLDRQPDMLRAWLRTVAGRIVIDGWRNRQCRPQEVDEAHADFLSVPDEGETTVARIAIYDALQRISPVHRETLAQIYFLDRTVHEAAAALAVPDGTIKSRIHYAVQALRRAVAERP